MVDVPALGVSIDSFSVAWERPFRETPQVPRSSQRIPASELRTSVSVDHLVRNDLVDDVLVCAINSQRPRWGEGRGFSFHGRNDQLEMR